MRKGATKWWDKGYCSQRTAIKEAEEHREKGKQILLRPRPLETQYAMHVTSIGTTHALKHV